MEHEEVLIELVRSHPELYGLQSKLYKNVPHKTKVWKDVGIQIGVDGETCQKRWMGLRACYRRAKRCDVVPSGSAAALPKRKWRHLDAMCFLDSVQSCRRTIANGAANVDEEFDSPAKDGEMSSQTGLQQEFAATSPAVNTAKRRCGNTMNTHSTSFLQQASNSIKEVSETFRSAQSPTEKIFLGLANLVTEADLDPEALRGIHREISAHVNDAIQRDKQNYYRWQRTATNLIVVFCAPFVFYSLQFSVRLLTIE